MELGVACWLGDAGSDLTLPGVLLKNLLFINIVGVARFNCTIGVWYFFSLDSYKVRIISASSGVHCSAIGMDWRSSCSKIIKYLFLLYIKLYQMLLIL